MNPAANFLRRFASIAAGNYGAIGLGFALNVLLTWRLGAAGYGRLALLVTAAQILACLTANWSIMALVRFGAQEFAQRGTVVETFWARTWLLAPWVAGSAGALTVWQVEAARYLDVSIAAVWLVFGYFLLSTVLLSLGSVFQAGQQMGRYALTLFLDKAITFIGILLAPDAYAREATVVIGWYALSSGLVSVWAAHALGKTMLWPVSCSRGTVRRLWAFSLPMILMTWLGIVGTPWVHYAIVKHFHPLEELGRYSLAIQLSGVVQQLSIILSSLLVPQFAVMAAEGRLETIKAVVQQIMPYGFLGFSVMLGVFTLLVPPGVPFIFGSEFAGATRPLALLMVATMGLAFYNALMPILTAQDSTWTLTGISLASAAINVGSALLLIPKHGGMGGALATVLGYGTAGLLMLIAVQDRLEIRIIRYVALAAPVAAAAFAAVVWEDSWLYLAGIAGIAVAAASAVGILGLFSRDDLAFLSQSGMPIPFKTGIIRAWAGRNG